MPDSPDVLDHSAAGRAYRESLARSDGSDRADRVEILRFDVAARRAVDLATGILMEQRGISAEEALALLEHLTDPSTPLAAAKGVVQIQTDENLSPALSAGRPAEVSDLAPPLTAASQEPPAP